MWSLIDWLSTCVGLRRRLNGRQALCKNGRARACVGSFLSDAGDERARRATVSSTWLTSHVLWFATLVVVILTPTSLHTLTHRPASQPSTDRPHWISTAAPPTQASKQRRPHSHHAVALSCTLQPKVLLLQSSTHTYKDGGRPRTSRRRRRRAQGPFMRACGRACVYGNLCGCALPRCFVVGRRSSFSHAHNPTRPKRAQEGLCLVCHKEEIQVIRLVLLMSVCVFCWLALPSVGVVRYGHMTDRITHATNPLTTQKYEAMPCRHPTLCKHCAMKQATGGKYVLFMWCMCSRVGGCGVGRSTAVTTTSSRMEHTHIINTTRCKTCGDMFSEVRRKRGA